MKKRTTALLLILAALLTLGVPALAEDGEPTAETAVETQEADVAEVTGETSETSDAEEAVTEEPDQAEAEDVSPDRAASGTVAFTELGAVMKANYYQLLALEENIAALKAANGDADTLRQLENAKEQMLLGGETLYITLVGLEAQDAALTRTIAALDRTEQEMTLRRELGQISDLQLSQITNGRAQAVSGQRTLRMNIELARMQLKAMTGVALDGTLTLAALPKVTAEQLAAMDVDTDLARAKQESYTLDEAKRAWDEAAAAADAGIAYGVPSAQNGKDAARYTYDSAVLTFELSFRTLYAQVKDCAQVLEAKRTALAAQEQSYAASALQYEQGRLSANALADAKDQLAEAKEAVATAERDLFAKYRSYQWAVDYGILNG